MLMRGRNLLHLGPPALHVRCTFDTLHLQDPCLHLGPPTLSRTANPACRLSFLHVGQTYPHSGILPRNLSWSTQILNLHGDRGILSCRCGSYDFAAPASSKSLKDARKRSAQFLLGNRNLTTNMLGPNRGKHPRGIRGAEEDRANLVGPLLPMSDMERSLLAPS